MEKKDKLYSANHQLNEANWFLVVERPPWLVAISFLMIFILEFCPFEGALGKVTLRPHPHPGASRRLFDRWIPMYELQLG